MQAMHGNSEPGIFVFGRKIISFPLFFLLPDFLGLISISDPIKYWNVDLLQKGR